MVLLNIDRGFHGIVACRAVRIDQGSRPNDYRGLSMPIIRIMAYRALSLIMIIWSIFQMTGNAISITTVIEARIGPCIRCMTD